jgi:hypothetical protein
VAGAPFFPIGDAAISKVTIVAAMPSRASACAKAAPMFSAAVIPILVFFLLGFHVRKRDLCGLTAIDVQSGAGDVAGRPRPTRNPTAAAKSSGCP